MLDHATKGTHLIFLGKLRYHFYKTLLLPLENASDEEKVFMS